MSFVSTASPVQSSFHHGFVQCSSIVVFHGGHVCLSSRVLLSNSMNVGSVVAYGVGEVWVIRASIALNLFLFFGQNSILALP